MDIFEFAMKMELDGKSYYESLEEKVNDEGMKVIFNMLAQDEQRHYDIIKNYHKGIELNNESEVLENAKNIFELMRQSNKTLQLNVEEDVLRHALDIERESVKYYDYQHDKSDDITEKEVLKKLIVEEKKHYFIIESLLNHISGGILRGIGSAEFHRWEMEMPIY